MDHRSRPALLKSVAYVWVILRSIALCTECLPDEQRLVGKLFDKLTYDNSVRPVFNSSENVVVGFGFSLIQIMDMDEKNQLLITNAWLQHTWIDERISWDAKDYNGLEVIRLPAKKLWLPDVVLYNNADDYTSGFMPINAMVKYNGEIFWSPPTRLRSSCKVDITYFPFDSQICKLKFGSWTYPKAQVDLVNMSGLVDLTTYTTNGEWMLKEYYITRNEIVYPIGNDKYPDVTVIIVIQRRILYYILNIIFPCFWLNVLSVLTFCLPPDAGEKISLSITVLLSYSVFMLLVAESMPPTSEFVPLIGIYLTVSMALASISVILTVFVLKIHHCAPHQPRVPKWVRKVVLGYLGGLLQCKCLKTQNNLGKRSRGGDIHGPEESEILSKLMNDIAATKDNNRRRCQPNDSYGSSQSEAGSVIADLRGSSFLADLRGSLNMSNRNSYVDDHNGNTDGVTDGKKGIMEDVLKYLQCMLAKNDQQDLEAEVLDEWKQVATVVDKALLWTFLGITLISTLIILIIIPLTTYSMTGGL
ncbi:neuronal acetylcholine receptor subunit alpha-10-like [Mizuhopecten yessoensis]|uniref:neuronal acetylcholine receptor subunit alpha-10-like n=1 Tax=Mizuhopecten yessoensis TaxID=6573 RepID=UPI000B45DA4C|nr:neuronal acetylcholine receptor subunit alpha-10-like [Mizuhopecten yessoensis]